jgi:hypothetical protein
MARYTVYEGKFKCHECGSLVLTIRSYPELRKITWMCKDRHLSEVSLITKKRKSDFERTG